jgi:hypothetical protein
MNAIDGTRLETIRERLTRWREARAALPQAREKLTEESYRLRRAEACVEEIQARIRRLESLSVSSLMHSLLGKKQHTLDQRSDELVQFEQQQQEAEAAVRAAQEYVEQLESQLADGDGAEEEYRSVVEERAQTILDADGEAAQRLAQITREWESAKTELRLVQRAAETGRQLAKHLQSLDSAVRNAKHNKALSGGLRGAVGGLINDAVASMGPKSAIRYVAESAQRFVRETAELPLTEEHANLMQVRAELEAYRACLADLSGITTWDQINTLSAEQNVTAANSQLKEWQNDAQLQVQALEQDRNELIEKTS